MKNRFKAAKKIFVDSVELEDYIKLESSVEAYKTLQGALEKPLKMILLFGKPGTGKSILLNRLAKKLGKKKEVYYLATPAVTLQEFLFKIYKIVLGESPAEGSEVNFPAIVNYCSELKEDREIIILLDEAQLYSEELLEKIRLLSDTRVIKFVISLHKTGDEDLIAKEHFKSRIWETIELENANPDELYSYIAKKLDKKGYGELVNSFDRKKTELMHQFTDGNFRETNKLLYTIFDICEYYDRYEPVVVANGEISTKIIEMAALKLGYIHA